MPQFLSRALEWFRASHPAMKAGIVSGIVLFGLVASRVLAGLATLVFFAFVIVLIVQAVRRRPVKTWAIATGGALVAVVLFSGVAAAIYGPQTEERAQTSGTEKPREEQVSSPEENTPAPIEAPLTYAEETPDKEQPKSDTEADNEKKEKPKEPKEPKKPTPKPRPAPSLDNAQASRGRYDATVTVSRVVDGDTIEISPAINGAEDVRLIGVDTPETVDPGESVEPYGPQASAFATRELTGEKVSLAFDEEKIDQYDRLLAYVYTGGSMFNEELLEKGYAQAYPYPPNTTYEMRFENAQREAKASDLGIWGLSLEQQCELADRGNGIGEGSIKCDLVAEESASPSASASASAPADSSASAAPAGGGAVAPVSEDDCPPNAPIKGNQSGLYHIPGGAYYDITNPEECFATAEDAEAAGYEASSR